MADRAPRFAAGTTPPPRPPTPPPSPFAAGDTVELVVLPLPGVSPLIGDRIPLLATTDAAADRLRAAAAAGVAAVLVGPAPATDGGASDDTPADWTSPGRGAPGMSPRGPGLPALVACVVIEEVSSTVATATVVARGVATAPVRRRRRVGGGDAMSPSGVPPPAVVVTILPTGDGRLPREAAAAAAPRVAWRAADAGAAVTALETSLARVLAALPPPQRWASPATRLARVAAALPLSPRFRATLLAERSVAAAAASLAAGAAALADSAARCRRGGTPWARGTAPVPATPPSAAALVDSAARCRRGGTPWARGTAPVPATPPSAAALVDSGGVAANPLGHAHAVTLVPASSILSASAVIVDGAPVPHASWLPPWHWSVGFCGACGVHAGWLFTPPPPPPGAGGEPPPPPPVGFLSMRAAVSEAGAEEGVFALRRAALASPDSDGDASQSDDDDDDDE